MKLIILVVLFISNTEAVDWENPKKHRELTADAQEEPDVSTRIIGGEPAIPNRYKYIAALTIDNSSFCGGSLISKTAHCVDAVKNYVEVILGAHFINKEYEPTRQTFNVSKNGVIVHECWNLQKLVNDIALLRLPRSARYNKFVQPVQLPCFAQSTNSFANTEGTVIGWGSTFDNTTPISSVLRSVSSDILSNKQCIIKIDILKPTQICLDGSQMKGTCLGDSGGPLTACGVQVGIVSYGLDGCQLRNPNVFTRITSYLDWISYHAKMRIC